jgi:multiple sugar transport system ATP-binding protein
MAKVDLDKVSKIYAGGVKAVNAIDLHIKDQEFVVLVGPSGCGKSTTLRMVAGLEEISDGTIRIGDRVVNDVAPKDRDIAMVFQNYALYPHMSVYKNMAFGLKLRGMPKAQIQQRVMAAAKTLDIEHLLERKPKALSGGQRQRVAVGRAIVREPAAFLFDEPLSNLDAKLRVTTRAELKRLHQRLKTTTIYVTHDQEEAMTLGDRIVCMKDGLIQQADTPLNTYNFPANRFVAGFIGMPPMNFFDGAIKRIDGQLVFEEGQLANATTVGGSDPDDPVVAVGELTLPGNGFTLPVPDRLVPAMSDKVGRHVVLGIRPEHFGLRPSDVPGSRASIEMVASVIEPLGNDMDVYMSTPLHEHVVGRVPARQGVELGKRIDVVVDLERAYFFEPGPTGLNLGLGVAAGVSAAAVNGSLAGATVPAGTAELTPTVA